MENMTEKETEKADKYELMSDGIVAESKNLLTNELEKANIYKRGMSFTDSAMRGESYGTHKEIHEPDKKA